MTEVKRCSCWHQNFSQMTKVTRGFCGHQNFVPWGCLPLTSSYIHLLNHEKICIKSEIEEILFKLATNDHSDKAFLLISKFWLEWVVCPYPRAMFKLLFLNNRRFKHILISSALRWAIQDQWSSGYGELMEIEHLLVTYVITTIISWTGSIILQLSSNTLFLSVPLSAHALSSLKVYLTEHRNW